jgi:hypothetical protein
VRAGLAAGLLLAALTAAHAEEPAPAPASPAAMSETTPPTAPASPAPPAAAPTPDAGAPAATSPPQAPRLHAPRAAAPAAAAGPAAAHDPTAPDAQVTALREEVSRLQAELDALHAAAAAQPMLDADGTAPQLPRQGWAWLIGASLGTLVAGFVLGWRMLDRRIRRKYGGLRIY